MYVQYKFCHTEFIIANYDFSHKINICMIAIIISWFQT